MSLEQKIEELIEALDRNTAAHAGASGSEGTSSGKGGGKSTPAADKGGASGKSKVTAEQVKAMAVRIKDEFGTADAKKLIKTAGKADQLADIDPKNYQAFVNAGQKLLDAKEEGGDGEGDGEGDGL